MSSTTTEEEILKTAEEFQSMEELAMKPSWKAPARESTHMDFLLEEMKWMAEDFSRERKWRLKNSSFFAGRCASAASKLSSSEMRRNIELSAKKKKIAAHLAKEINKFWKKAEKVVNYTIKKRVEGYKKKLLNGHLKTLVKQTEKFSSMLAKHLQMSDHQQSKEKRGIKRKNTFSEQGETKRNHTETNNKTSPKSQETNGISSIYSNSKNENNVSHQSESNTEEESTSSEEEHGGNISELVDLDEEANMTLEELMARYNLSVHENCTINYDTTTTTSGSKANLNGNGGGVILSNGEAQRTESNNSITELTSAIDLKLKEQEYNKGLSIKLNTEIPFYLKHELRAYQHLGLDWLITIYKKNINGILADEMGLGKTIMTIALLSWLAWEQDTWGPHLIIVPTSVLLQWEMEFKKWCPALKILTYFGNIRERKNKRLGWSKPDAFHVCITSYTIVLQDNKMFRRKKWNYMVLDEAHMIKNWKSQRWQTLLNFKSKRRLLLTGTPLQNNLMELWSLMHFLMPHIFSSHAHFKNCFSNPFNEMASGGEDFINQKLVHKLHGILRPFILRRLKCDVEKQLPKKYEHVIYCQLSKRQRKLYEEYITCKETRDTLSSKNYLGIINILMQLRKVCNHPNLFEGRPIITPFDMDPVDSHLPSLIFRALGSGANEELQEVDLKHLNLLPTWYDLNNSKLHKKHSSLEIMSLEDMLKIGLENYGEVYIEQSEAYVADLKKQNVSEMALAVLLQSISKIQDQDKSWRHNRLTYLNTINKLNYNSKSIYDIDLMSQLNFIIPLNVSKLKAKWDHMPNALINILKSHEDRYLEIEDILKIYICYISKARSPPRTYWCSYPNRHSVSLGLNLVQRHQQYQIFNRNQCFWTSYVRTQLFFPDKRLVEFDCGKLQELVILLKKLHTGGHRILLFTQMSRMLDILELFLTIHGYVYLRLDGSTKPEERYKLMQRFNNNTKYFIFILSTRSGGLGVTLTGADTVIFYDTDWNPAMDRQAQDRCHRIGQTREVHIYRLISQYTVEENIMKKSEEKKQLDFLAIQSGAYDLSYLTKMDPIMDIFEEANKEGILKEEIKEAMEKVEDVADVAAANAAEDEIAMEMEEFDMEDSSSKVTHGSEVDDEQEMTLDDEDDNVEMEDIQKALDNLRPIDKYAIKYIEDTNVPVDIRQIANQQLAEVEVEMKKANSERGSVDTSEYEFGSVVSSEDLDKDEIIEIYNQEIKEFNEAIEEEKRIQAENLKRIEEEAQKRNKKISILRIKEQIEHDLEKKLEAFYDSLVLNHSILMPWTREEDLVLCYMVCCALHGLVNINRPISDQKLDIMSNYSEIWRVSTFAIHNIERYETNAILIKRSQNSCKNRYLQLYNAFKRNKPAQNKKSVLNDKLTLLDKNVTENENQNRKWLKIASSRYTRPKLIENHIKELKDKIEALVPETTSSISETDINTSTVVNITIAEANKIFNAVSKMYGIRQSGFLRRLSTILFQELYKNKNNNDQMRQGLQLIHHGYTIMYSNQIVQHQRQQLSAMQHPIQNESRFRNNEIMQIEKYSIATDTTTTTSNTTNTNTNTGTSSSVSYNQKQVLSEAFIIPASSQMMRPVITKVPQEQKPLIKSSTGAQTVRKNVPLYKTLPRNLTLMSNVKPNVKIDTSSSVTLPNTSVNNRPIMKTISEGHVSQNYQVQRPSLMLEMMRKAHAMSKPSGMSKSMNYQQSAKRHKQMKN